MSTLEIPLPVDTPLFSQRTTLDGVEYFLKFDWHGRESRWYLGIYDVDESPIYVGIKLVCNWPLLRLSADPRIPKGVLMAIDYSNQGGEPPILADLGRRVQLTYVSVI